MPSCAQAFGVHPHVYLYPFPACAVLGSLCAGCAVPRQLAWGRLLGLAKVWGVGSWVLSQLSNVVWWGGVFHKGKANLGQPAQIANWLKGKGRKTSSTGQPGRNSHGVK